MVRIIFVLLIWISLISFVSPYELTITSEISGDNVVGTGIFIAGVSNSAIDEIDVYDGRMIENPSYGIPIYSIISNENFMIDYKSDIAFGESKKWSLVQRGSRDFRNLNNLNEQMRWDLSNLPPNMQVVLIDYGLDSSRNLIVAEINLRDLSSYKFQVSNIYGEYRYFDLILTLVSVSQEVILNTKRSSDSSSGGNNGETSSQDIINLDPKPENPNKNEEVLDLSNNRKTGVGITGAAIGNYETAGIGVVLVVLSCIIVIIVLIKRKN